MSDVDSLLAATLAAARRGAGLDARLLLAAAVTALAPTGVRPVVVGGTAVDFWAAQALGDTLVPAPGLRPSLDVDVVVLGQAGDDERIRKALLASGRFENPSAIEDRLARRWYAKDLPFSIDVLGPELAGDPERVAQLDVEGATVWMWSAEDTTWQYAENALSMRSRHDWARALAIRGAQELDLPYLRTLAGNQEHIIDALEAGTPYDELGA